MSGGASAETAIRLAATVAFVIAIAWIAGRVGRARRRAAPAPVRVVYRLPVAKGLQVVAVRVGERGVLLAVAGTAVQSVADLSAEEIAALEAGRAPAPLPARRTKELGPGTGLLSRMQRATVRVTRPSRARAG